MATERYIPLSLSRARRNLEGNSMKIFPINGESDLDTESWFNSSSQYFNEWNLAVLKENKSGQSSIIGKNNAFQKAISLIEPNTNSNSLCENSKLCNKLLNSNKIESTVKNESPYIYDNIGALKESLGGLFSDDIIAKVMNMKVNISTEITEDNIAGLRETKKLINEKIIYPIKRPELYKGLHKPPKGILFFGPPGTGKTLLAKWVANSSGANFFEVSPSSLLSKYYGETETIAKAIFKISEFFSPSIVFIDEIDALLGQRRNADDDLSIRMKNQLLQLMDGLSWNSKSLVIVIGATNRPDMLDSAAIRRFSKRILIGLPDLESREEQIKKLLVDHYCRLYGMNNMNDNKNDNDGKTLLPILNKDITCIAHQIEGWNSSDIVTLCSKAADFSYNDAIEKYKDIDKIPSVNCFRRICYNDFVLALTDVKPSSNSNINEKLIEWSTQFGTK